MLTRSNGTQIKVHYITIEDLVPSGHLLRQIEYLIDFSFIYDEVKNLYSINFGRPGIDPVVLVKYLLIGFLYGIESERRIEQEIQVNVAYRWFLGLDLDGKVPDHSTISQNRRRRFNGQNFFRKLFEQVLYLCMDSGLVEGKVILTDSTHIKANASRKSERKIWVEQETHNFMERLDRQEAIERERLEHEKGLPPKREKRIFKPKPKVQKIVSSTDPDAGFLVRRGKPLGMHYLSHQSLDSANGIIVDVAVTPGNVNDCIPYLDRMDYITDHIGLPVEKAGVDGAYDRTLIHKELADKNIVMYTPPDKNTGGGCKVQIDRTNFQYDELSDTFTCPMGKRLRLRNLERSDGLMKAYKADRKDCRICSKRDLCVCASGNERTLRVNVFENAVKQNRERDGSPEHQQILNLRQIWCEGTFAAQKRNHNLRQLFRVGIEAAETHGLLSATALNIRRMVKYLT